MLIRGKIIETWESVLNPEYFPKEEERREILRRREIRTYQNNRRKARIVQARIYNILISAAIAVTAVCAVVGAITILQAMGRAA